MRRLIGEALSVTLAFLLANFLWQLAFDKDWMEAVKISYFQGICLWWFVWRIKK